MAVKTGRSGQPVQKVGGRGGSSPTAAAPASLWARSARTRAATASASNPWGRVACEEAGEPGQQNVGLVFAALGQHVLAEHAGRQAGAAQLHVDGLLDVVRETLLDHQHGALAGAERAHLLGHQRIDHVEDEDRDAACAEHVGEIEPRQRPQHAVGEPAHHHDAHVVDVAGQDLVERARADEGERGRQPILDLQPLLHEGQRRMREPAIVEARRPGQPMAARMDRRRDCSWP